MIRYTPATTKAHLQAILDLQSQNLPQNISTQEAHLQGFVTVQHDIELLQKMNNPFPHIIAIEAQKVIAYALVMLRDLSNEIPILKPMFEHINPILYNNQPLGESRYFVMGQICIAKNYRSQGVFPQLYKALQNQMSPHFDYCITEISKQNLRSQKAHFKVGFEVIKEYEAQGKTWLIVLLKMR